MIEYTLSELFYSPGMWHAYVDANKKSDKRELSKDGKPVLEKHQDCAEMLEWYNGLSDDDREHVDRILRERKHARKYYEEL